MGKIFGISNLPVSRPFPSLEYGGTKLIQIGGETISETSKIVSQDTFVKKAYNNTIKTQLAKFLHRKHTKA